MTGKKANSSPDTTGEDPGSTQDAAKKNTKSSQGSVSRNSDALPGSYYAKFVSIVQSSGTGKTKTVVEVG